jgi:hypothetical protein
MELNVEGIQESKVNEGNDSMLGKKSDQMAMFQYIQSGRNDPGKPYSPLDRKAVDFIFIHDMVAPEKEKGRPSIDPEIRARGRGFPRV